MSYHILGVIYPKILFNIFNFLVKCTSSYTQNAVGPTICSSLNTWLWKYLLPQQNIRWTLKSKHEIKIDPIYFNTLLVLLWTFHQFMLIQMKVSFCNLWQFPLYFDLNDYPFLLENYNSSNMGCKLELTFKVRGKEQNHVPHFKRILCFPPHPSRVNISLPFLFFHPSLTLAWHIHFACF